MNLAILLLAALAVQCHKKDMHLLKVHTISKDGNVAVESVAYSSDMTLAGMRASAPPQSPIKWAAFCKSRTMGLHIPYFSLDYEADDLQRVSSYYSPDDEVGAMYVFVVKNGHTKDMFPMPVCPYSTFSQLRDRIGHYLDTRDFTFEIDDLDEENTIVGKYVHFKERLSKLMPGSSIKSPYNGPDDIRPYSIHITTGGPGVQRKRVASQNKLLGLVNKVKDLARVEGETLEEPKPQIVTCAVMMPDESLLLVPKVDLNTTSVSDFRDMIKKRLDENQTKAQMHEKVAICSPYTEAELAEDDMLADHVVVSASDTVTFTCRFMQLVDWQVGGTKADQPTMVTVCPRSSYKQLIQRAAPSFTKSKSVTSYAIPENLLLTSSVNNKFMYGSQSDCKRANRPLHLRHVDSIFMHVQDGHGHKQVMVQDQQHIYKVSTVYERFEELLGRERAWSMALCVPQPKAFGNGAVEMPITSSLREYDLDVDGIELDAMVVRVKVTVEADYKTRDLLMNVCADSLVSDLETRIRRAVGAQPDDRVYFFSRRANSSDINVNDVDLRDYRTRPPVHPKRCLYVWVGQKPFFTLDRLKHVDGLHSKLNISYTLPDETVLVLNNVDQNMPVSGLRAEIGKRLKSESWSKALLPTLALCSDLHVLMKEDDPIGKYFSLGDNFMSLYWITLMDYTSNEEEPTVVTACAGDTYRSLLQRCTGVKDVSHYQVMDGSSLDLTVAKEYLSSDSAKYSARTLSVKARNERLVTIVVGDGREVTVSVSADATIGDLRAVLAKRVGVPMAWGTGFCLPSGWERVFMGAGEVDEKRRLDDLFGSFSSSTLPIRFSGSTRKTVLLRLDGNVTRIPATMCSGSFDDLKRRLRKAVGASEGATVLVAEDQRSPLVRFLPFINKSTDLVHVDVVDVGSGTAGTEKKKDVVKVDANPDTVKADTDRPEQQPLEQTEVKSDSEAHRLKMLGIGVGLVLVVAVMAFLMFGSEEPPASDVGEPAGAILESDPSLAVPQGTAESDTIASETQK